MDDGIHGISDTRGMLVIIDRNRGCCCQRCLKSDVYSRKFAIL